VTKPPRLILLRPRLSARRSGGLRSATRSTATARPGITLVEILIAVTVLTVGVGGLLKNSASVATQMGGGMRQTVAATVAQSRVDSLSSLSCATLANASVATGTSTKRGVTETWAVTDGRNVKNIIVTISVVGRRNPIRYNTVIPCRD
jgi:hypothetical protein